MASIGRSPTLRLRVCLLALLLREAVALRLQGEPARKPVRLLSGGAYSLEDLEGELEGSLEFGSQWRPPWDFLNPLVPGTLSFSSNPGDYATWKKHQEESEVAETHTGLGFKLNFSKVYGRCNKFSRPFADFDTKQGHGNPWCRYEPSLAELAKYKADPIDLAIVIPHDSVETVSAISNDELNFDPEQGAHAWRAYAKFHGYAYYQGQVDGPENCYKHVMHSNEEAKARGGRAPAWVKPCAALQLIRRHKYLLVVDADTFVTKPALRMEPLFEKAGLLKEDSKRSIALATEWGSCVMKSGMQLACSGHVNTGVMLLKHTAEEALRAWVYGNPGCTGLECGQWKRSINSWGFDQYGFAAAVSGPAWVGHVTVLPTGCPINGPWGDFVAHLVGGSFNRSFYDPSMRGQILTAARRCVESVLQRPSGMEYHRCSLCDLVDRNAGPGFNISCAGRR